MNGRSLGRQPAGASAPVPRRVRDDLRARRARSGGLADGHETGRTEPRSATGPVLLDARVDRAEIRADPSDLAFVDLTLVDEAGSLYTAADRRVTVELDGPGELQGLGNANPSTEEGFTDTACTTFDGRALAVVRPTAAGTITLMATVDGCEPVRVSIEAALSVGRP